MWLHGKPTLNVSSYLSATLQTQENIKACLQEAQEHSKLCSQKNFTLVVLIECNVADTSAAQWGCLPQKCFRSAQPVSVGFWWPLLDKEFYIVLISCCIRFVLDHMISPQTLLLMEEVCLNQNIASAFRTASCIWQWCVVHLGIYAAYGFSFACRSAMNNIGCSADFLMMNRLTPSQTPWRPSEELHVRPCPRKHGILLLASQLQLAILAIVQDVSRPVYSG